MTGLKNLRFRLLPAVERDSPGPLFGRRNLEKTTNLLCVEEQIAGFYPPILTRRNDRPSIAGQTRNLAATSLLSGSEAQF
jgi:hypothetical protein